MAKKPQKTQKQFIFGTGALPDPIDKRDYILDDFVAAAGEIKIDWDKGYDIRNEIGGDIFFKNQCSSSSCVGQGVSYYGWVKQIIEVISKYNSKLEQIRSEHPSDVNDFSAKSIYSQIFLPPTGGAYIRDGMKKLCEWGCAKDSDVPSNKADGSTDEDFMRDKSWINENITSIASIFKGKDYRTISATSNMDLFAYAIMNNHGVVGGVYGSNNGTWSSENPQPPIDGIGWGHCIYFGAFGKDELGKFIAFPNSWGNILGKKWYSGAPNGYGWQKLRESYFVDGGKYIFSPWTYTDNLNNNQEDMPQTNVKIIKDANSKAVGFWCPANNEDGFISMARNYGINPPLNDDGTLNWDKVEIQGTLTLK